MLSEHFSLEEMSYSRIAVEQAIDNEPPEAEREAMRHLAIHLLEPLRLLYGAPIAILSGFRNRRGGRLLYAGCGKIIDGSPFFRAGIRPGDILLQAEFPAFVVEKVRGEPDAGLVLCMLFCFFATGMWVSQAN
mgnify:CR=1 FL=1